MPVAGRSPGSRVRTKQQGKAAIDDESSNVPCHPGAATKAIPKGQASSLAPGGERRYPAEYLIGDHESRESPCASETAQAFRMNLVREPDAGNPHVRFDEREVETEQGKASEAPATERVGNR